MTEEKKYTVSEFLDLLTEKGYHVRANTPPPRPTTWHDWMMFPAMVGSLVLVMVILAAFHREINQFLIWVMQ